VQLVCRCVGVTVTAVLVCADRCCGGVCVCVLLLFAVVVVVVVGCLCFAITLSIDASVSKHCMEPSANTNNTLAAKWPM